MKHADSRIGLDAPGRQSLDWKLLEPDRSYQMCGFDCSDDQPALRRMRSTK